MARGRFRKQRDPEGRMSLGDHLRELRRRFVIAAIAILLGAVVGWWKYSYIISKVAEPLTEIDKERGQAIASLNFANPTDSFSIAITVGLFVGVIIASPVWLYQIWGFILPGLTRREKRTAAVFIVAAVPLFLAGCWLGYLTMPKAIHALLSFTPDQASNIVPADVYLNFVLKFILAFGLAFLLPVFLVGLNAAGVLPARTMLKAWRPAVFLVFLFAAIMTPSPDPWSMIFLAVPMVALFFGAVGVALVLDRRRAKRDESAEWRTVPDDQASKL
ncbi:twin-arginine translocase subunit TatC [Lapillicoccus sp.]|uniref:twin-arginine translocase subunit TatC n=1 Tax=Lapillicoccus sp. TaxID=1909287 RepID=UPI003264A11A